MGLDCANDLAAPRRGCRSGGISRSRPPAGSDEKRADRIRGWKRELTRGGFPSKYTTDRESAVDSTHTPPPSIRWCSAEGGEGGSTGDGAVHPAARAGAPALPCIQPPCVSGPLVCAAGSSSNEGHSRSRQLMVVSANASDTNREHESLHSNDRAGDMRTRMEESMRAEEERAKNNEIRSHKTATRHMGPMKDDKGIVDTTIEG